MSGEESRFQLRQFGMVVASGSAADANVVIREALHYAGLYVQDGPITLTIKISQQQMFPPPSTAAASRG